MENQSETEIAKRGRAVVIGAGPAGLMAAGELARAGLAVTLTDAMPTPARKFLMAGKSGLNLTKDEPLDTFLDAIDGDFLRPILSDFGPEAVQDWARGLGADLFTGSSGRVFPREMKASPLLRAWLARLSGRGAVLRTRWRWTGWDAGALAFQTPEGPRIQRPDVTVLALGGASWPRLGSTGDWVEILQRKGVAVTPLAPANVGLSVAWSGHMARHFGAPVKAVRLTAGDTRIRGEFVISRKGLEGSAIYAVSKPVREGAPLTLDLVPDLSAGEVTARLARRGKASIGNHLRKRLKLDPARLALLMEFGRPLPGDSAVLARLVKALPVVHAGPRPLAEAISTAGGIAADALTPDLMLRALPGVFAAGEMLDWEAPTGGYLISASLATGRHAGRAAAHYTLAQARAADAARL